MGEVGSLLTLFAAAFGAATILPFQSEVVFVAMQLGDAAPVVMLVLWASIGNVLGACVNYALGRWASHLEQRPWFPASRAQIARAEGWYVRWGVWTLLLSWAPFGDAFTVIAGLLRTPLWLFVVLVTIAKTGRYIALAWVTSQV